MTILVRLWILLSAALVGAGWILSALHALNPAGYALVFLPLAAAGIVWWRKTASRLHLRPAQAWHKLARRFQRPAPFLFVLLLGLAFACGILYAPVPGDASMYRTPRVLHWLAAGQWHWIRTFDSRLNTRGCGFEWLTAPMMLFTHTDRLFFLINLFAYALLPGLIFSVFRRLQVRSRVAWWWMWLLPAAWCFALQAGSVANDGFATIYALAAVDFALRAAENKRVGDLWLSLLAMALLTGVKQTLIPLALLWLIAAWPASRLLRLRPLASAAVAAAGLLISAGPMIYLNLRHGGNWVGVPKHPDPMDPWGKLVDINSPFWGVIGNTFYLLIQNFAPPFILVNKQWNEMMLRFTETPLGAHFASFQSFGQLPSYLTEQTSGLGLIICLLLLASIFWAWRWRKKHFPTGATPNPGWQIRLLWLVPWGLLLLFMAKVGTIETARLISPYYPFLLLLILVQPGMSALIRQRWWQRFALLAMIVPAILLVVAPSRPLWPAGTILNRLVQHHSNSNLVRRIQSFYSAPEINQLARHAFQFELPMDEPVIGYATDIRGIEPGLWLPFHRRVERVLPTDTRLDLDALGIRYVVVDANFLPFTKCNIDQLSQRYGAGLVDQLALPGGWQAPPNYVYLLRLN